MDVISIKVNLVIEPLDGFTGERNLQGAVFAKINDSYAVKKDGCFVFFNKPYGKYKVTVGGNCYQTAEFEVEFDDQVKTVSAVLMPSRNYKFPRTAVKLYGKSKFPAKICFIYGSEHARILGEYKTGDTKINAFFSENDPAKKYFLGEETYSLSRLNGTEYEIDRPLESDISADSVIGICREIDPGNYFAAVSEKFKKAEIICENDKKIIELSGENTEYNIE